MRDILPEILKYCFIFGVVILFLLVLWCCWVSCCSNKENEEIGKRYDVESAEWKSRKSWRTRTLRSESRRRNRYHRGPYTARKAGDEIKKIQLEKVTMMDTSGNLIMPIRGTAEFNDRGVRFDSEEKSERHAREMSGKFDLLTIFFWSKSIASGGRDPVKHPAHLKGDGIPKFNHYHLHKHAFIRELDGSYTNWHVNFGDPVPDPVISDDC